MGLRDNARDAFERDGSGGLRRWCEAAEGAAAKAHRFNGAARFCAEQRDRATGAERKKFAELRQTFAAERDKWERRYERRHDLDLPERIHFAELLYHDPPHTHVAIADRDDLIRVARVGKEKYGLRIGEFPPFDTVEDVHTFGSWHYRDPSRPFEGVPFNAEKLRLGGPWGLAFDGNDVDGGSDEEFAFYLELRSRAV